MSSRIHVGWGWLLVAGILCGLGLLGPVEPVWGDGFIVVKQPRPDDPSIVPSPRPVPRTVYMPLRVKYHHVEVEITDNAAVTKIDQVFCNPNKRQLEGTYMFPLADDVAVQRFSMYMDGKEVQGEVLEKDKARKIYEDIVRQMKDPALLEYVGSRMYKARVFPIPAQGEVRIKMDYAQVVPVSAGLATYVYPLNTEKFSSAPLEEVAVRVRIKSRQALSTVFCPSHNSSVDRKGKHEAVVGYEGRNVLPDKDFIVSYKTSDEAFGLVLLTHREGGEDGYFMARVSPASKVDEEHVIPKDICFVIDTSGSMSGKKIEQAREALRFCLDNLNRKDRFNVMSFSTEVRPYQDELTPASRDNVSAAREHVAGFKAIGGTAINEALLAALESGKKGKEDTGRPYMIVFLTDGLPTVGERDVEKILANVKRSNPGNVRLFVFGVGHDVNTRLLDKLAEENHGAREYVSEQEDLEVKLSGFYTMIANPVLSDLRLDFGDAGASDVYPKVLPDLFQGTELVVLGRYEAAGKQSITLHGQRGDERVKFTWDEKFAKRKAAHDYLPRLWASRKIGYLLDEIRLHGEDKELKEEVVQLAKRFGILTPYTSFLVIEEDQGRIAAGRPVASPAISSALSARGVEDGARDARLGYYGRSGKAAVGASKHLAEMQRARAPSQVEQEVRLFLNGVADHSAPGEAGRAGEGGVRRAGAAVRFVGSRTFYRDGEKWVDSRYEAGSETIKLRMFSDAYFDLIAQHPDAGKYLALGNRVVVVLEGKAYETVEE